MHKRRAGSWGKSAQQSAAGGEITMDNRALFAPGSGAIMVLDMASSRREKSDCTPPLAGLKMQYSKLVQKTIFRSTHTKLCRHPKKPLLSAQFASLPGPML